MTETFNIYAQHADKYHALVSAEDIDQNLKSLLYENVDFNGKTVIEAGLGTGRVTSLYLNQAKKIWGFDQSQHMLDYAYKSLKSPRHVTLEAKTHDKIFEKQIQADIFIEGWAFGHWYHTLLPEFKPVLTQYFQTLEATLNPKGNIVLIETLGTFRTTPFKDSDLTDFYAFLEEYLGFQRFEIRTDYAFKDLNEAIKIIGFFFGEDMAKAVAESGKARVPEMTGVWIKSL